MYDPDDGLPRALPESMLPVVLPDVDDYSPITFPDDDETSEPVPPLARATDWVEVTLDLGEGTKTYRRETNTMPQWAGSCWYELRYLDPTNDKAFVDPENERYWMGPRRPGDPGGVDLYVGGAEHAVLHLLYARFWHKVLFDLGHISSFEPYRRLFNQGVIQAYEFTDRRGAYVEAREVTEHDGAFWHGDQQVERHLGRMGKSRKNAVAPDEMYESYGADTLRLYEMFTGPLDQSRPWDTTAIVGSYRLLQRIWRNVVDEDTGEVTVSDDAPDDDTARLLARTVAAVRDGMEKLRFNVSIAKITELNNHLTARYPSGGAPRAVVEPLVLLLAPLAPHIARGAVVPAGPPRLAGRRAVPRGRSGAAGRRDDRDPRPGQREGPGPGRRPGRRRRRRGGGRGPGRRPGGGPAGGRDRPQGGRRPGPVGQLRGGLTACPGCFVGRRRTDGKVCVPHGAVAQLVERVHGMDEVARSIRVGSTLPGRSPSGGRPVARPGHWGDLLGRRRLRARSAGWRPAPPTRCGGRRSTAARARSTGGSRP